MAFLRPRARIVAPLALASASFVGCGGAPGAFDPLGSSSDAVKVCAAGATVKGVDVSYYQGTINWSSVHADGNAFAIARISDGTYLDTKFASYWPAIKAQGMVRGAYQFFEPADDPTTQANIVINAVGTLGAGDLPVTADVEVTGGQSAATIVANLKTWIAAVEAGTGKTPMIYTAYGFWNGSVNSTAFGGDPLWVANWGVTCPTTPTGWSAWKFWQDSDSGTVGGIAGAVDTDVFNGSLTDLQNFAGGGGSTAQWGAKYVSQSFPLASQALVMTAGDSVVASLTLKNSGTKAWDANTRLATTQPRDRASAFVASDWINDHRPAGVVGTVAPGGTYQFDFTFHAPSTPGTYFEYFGVVEEGTAWFSDGGQLGPPDDQLEAQIQVVAGTGGSGGGGGSGGSAGSGGAGGSGGVGGSGGAGGSGGSAGAGGAGGGGGSSGAGGSGAGGAGGIGGSGGGTNPGGMGGGGGSSGAGGAGGLGGFGGLGGSGGGAASDAGTDGAAGAHTAGSGGASQSGGCSVGAPRANGVAWSWAALAGAALVAKRRGRRRRGGVR